MSSDRMKKDHMGFMHDVDCDMSHATVAYGGPHPCNQLLAQRRYRYLRSAFASLLARAMTGDDTPMPDAQFDGFVDLLMTQDAIRQPRP